MNDNISTIKEVKAAYRIACRQIGQLKTGLTEKVYAFGELHLEGFTVKRMADDCGMPDRIKGLGSTLSTVVSEGDAVVNGKRGRRYLYKIKAEPQTDAGKNIINEHADAVAFALLHDSVEPDEPKEPHTPAEPEQIEEKPQFNALAQAAFELDAMLMLVPHMICTLESLGYEVLGPWDEDA